MRISIYIAVSANGLISNFRNVPDWLSPEYGQGFMEICQKTKAVIMGKTTYNILAPDYLPLQKEGTIVVLTTDEQAKSDNPTVVFTKSNAPEIAKMLAGKGHDEAVIIGGTMTMSEFINADLVDDIYFVMEPVLFGSGLPLLKNVELEFKLKLLEVTKLNNNSVQLHYEIQKQS
ncbi:dihydrofolate reductase family protein [Parapedobacter tibetensis]|uniref:dihydrofolate reductase family protein n=1 Tax=Parapedobacter tibetensis TaxID=2972951 RepID=UPI00214D72B9|nr:dihydrofolate reductase family protein [Parapedobacter tibetensis]